MINFQIIFTPKTISLVCSYPEKTMSIDNQALTALKNSGQEVKNNTNQTSELSKEEKLRKRRTVRIMEAKSNNSNKNKKRYRIRPRKQKIVPTILVLKKLKVPSTKNRRMETSKITKQQATKEKTTTITIKKKFICKQLDQLLNEI